MGDQTLAVHTPIVVKFDIPASTDPNLKSIRELIMATTPTLPLDWDQVLQLDIAGAHSDGSSRAAFQVVAAGTTDETAFMNGAVYFAAGALATLPSQRFHDMVCRSAAGAITSAIAIIYT